MPGGFEIAAEPNIYNVDVGTSESSLALPEGTKKVRMQCRTAVDVRYAFVTGKVAGPTAPYATLKSGQVLEADLLWLQGKTLYFAAGSSVVVEVIAWQ